MTFASLSLKKKKSFHFRKALATPGLLKSCRKKNILYKKYLSNPTVDNKLKFTCYRSKFKKVKEAAITQFFSNKFLYENNCRKTWGLINHLMNRDNHYSLSGTFYSTDGQPLILSPTKIANSFNAFFSNIGKELAKKITLNST